MAVDVILWAAYNNVDFDDPRFVACDNFKRDMEAAIPRTLRLEKLEREIVVLQVARMAHETIA
jgi:hypothetical protein